MGLAALECQKLNWHLLQTFTTVLLGSNDKLLTKIGAVILEKFKQKVNLSVSKSYSFRVTHSDPFGQPTRLILHA